MIKTLLLYDGKMSSAERIATNLSYLIGSAKVADMSEAPSDLSPYGGICLVFNFYGAVTAGKITGFITERTEYLKGKRFALVGNGFSDNGFMNYLVTLERNTGLQGIEGYFITRESEAPRIGSEIGRMMQAPVHPMDEEELMPRIERFIKEHHTLSLGTAEEESVRSTPMDYYYLDGRFYLVTEGGMKFRGIMANGQASAAIFDQHDAEHALKGLQITAEAEIVPVGTDEYQIVMSSKNYSSEILASMEISLFLIKLTPQKYEYFDETLVDEGYDAKQITNTAFRRATWQAGALYAEQAEQGEGVEVSEVPVLQDSFTPSVEEEKEFFEHRRRRSQGEVTAREALQMINEVNPPEEEASSDAEDTSEEYDDMIFNGGSTAVDETDWEHMTIDFSFEEEQQGSDKEEQQEEQKEDQKEEQTEFNETDENDENDEPIDTLPDLDGLDYLEGSAYDDTYDKPYYGEPGDALNYDRENDVDRVTSGDSGRTRDLFDEEDPDEDGFYQDELNADEFDEDDLHEDDLDADDFDEDALHEDDLDADDFDEDDLDEDDLDFDDLDVDDEEEEARRERRSRRREASEPQSLANRLRETFRRWTQETQADEDDFDEEEEDDEEDFLS